MKEGEITEDFTKFLVNKRGRVVERYAADVPFAQIEEDIKKIL